jgi:hypothetical protein
MTKILTLLLWNLNLYFLIYPFIFILRIQTFQEVNYQNWICINALPTCKHEKILLTHLDILMFLQD